MLSFIKHLLICPCPVETATRVTRCHTPPEKKIHEEETPIMVGKEVKESFGFIHTEKLVYISTMMQKNDNNANGSVLRVTQVKYLPSLCQST